VAIALSHLLTDHSRNRIGHFFGGRDPTTVRHACEAVHRRCRADPNLHEAMRRLTLDLIGRG
jgi:chromosomal replication initiation ATPase DnaA